MAGVVWDGDDLVCGQKMAGAPETVTPIPETTTAEDEGDSLVPISGVQMTTKGIMLPARDTERNNRLVASRN